MSKLFIDFKYAKSWKICDEYINAFGALYSNTEDQVSVFELRIWIGYGHHNWILARCKMIGLEDVNRSKTVKSNGSRQILAV